VIAAIRHLITGIRGAGHDIGTIRRRSGLAVVHRITHLSPVAKLTVTAQTVVGYVGTHVVDFVARVHRATDAVITIRRGTSLATVDRVAGFHTVAKLPVVTRGVVRAVHTDVVHFITGVNRAADGVVTIGRCAGLAVVKGITRLAAVAEQPVVAHTVLTRVVATIGHLIARIRRAGNAVRAVRSRSRLTIVDCVAGLDAVAEKTVVAQRIGRRVNAYVVDFVTRIHRTHHTVATVRCGSRLAVVDGVTCLDPIAERAVIA